MNDAELQHLFEGYWTRVCAKVRRPLSGVLLPEGAVEGIAVEVFEAFYRSHDQLPARAEIAKFLIVTATAEALNFVAKARAESADKGLYHDEAEDLYAEPLDLADLQRQSVDGRFDGAAWEELPGVLRGRAWVTSRRCGVPEAEFEDLFVDGLAALAQVRAKDGRAPIQQLTVFEEVVPLFTTMIHNRGVSWLRKQSALKNRPNNPAYGDSLDDPDRYLAPASSGRVDEGSWQGWSFDRIYDACRDCLNELEWFLVLSLFVEANATRGELADNPWVIEQMGVKPKSSMGNRRRHLNNHLQAALDKLGKCLRSRDV